MDLFGGNFFNASESESQEEETDEETNVDE
jgi:hypothetical protein